jgi:hypothetical protein
MFGVVFIGLNDGPFGMRGLLRYRLGWQGVFGGL